MSNTATATLRRRRLAPLVAILGVVVALIWALSWNPANSAFTASINNTTNNVGTGTVLLSETQGATTCLSSAAGTVTTANAGNCATINKLGGNNNAKPGDTFTSTVTITNAGTLPASSFTLTPSGCTVTANGTVNGSGTADFCNKVNLTINDDTTNRCVFPASASAACAAPSNTNNLASLGTAALTLATPLAPGASRIYTFTVQIDTSATNAHQGLRANEGLIWAIAS